MDVPVEISQLQTSCYAYAVMSQLEISVSNGKELYMILEENRATTLDRLILSYTFQKTIHGSIMSSTSVAIFIDAMALRRAG